MDDEDSKVRRNLVVASSLVLLLVWLKLPLADVAERLLGTKSNEAFQIDAFRIWSAVAVSLAYFALRFVQSDYFEKAGETVRHSSILARAAVIDRVVRWELWLFNLFDKESPVFPSGLKSELKSQTDEMLDDLQEHSTVARVGVGLNRGRASPGEFHDSHHDWNGAINLSWSWTTDKGGSVSSSGGALGWAIYGYRRWIVIVVAFARVAGLSRVGVSLLYPLVLFTCAMLTSLVMLWRAL